jgi:UDP-galactopyranose mutase
MKSLIVFSHLRWDFVFQRPQHLMMRLAKNYRVFFLEEPCLIEGVPHWKIKRPAENVWVCQPHTNIAAGGFHDEQLSVLRPLLADLVMQHSLTKPDVWFYTPMALPLLSGLDAQIVVYDCMDELASFKNAPRQLLQREHALLKICDLVFTGGPSLYRAKQPRHDAVHCFPSSVERAHFARGADPANEHPEQQQVGRPRLGFFGVIDERLDIALLDRLATSHPEWQIIMVGPVVKIDPATLPQHPNVHYFGARPYAELPRFLAGWDVCLLPFARNDATRFISPTKTLEYMAAGKPIVSTPVTDVAEPYSSVVRIGVDDGFVAACAAALTETCDEQARRVARMRDIVDRTSWDRTAQQMRELIEERAARAQRLLHVERAASKTGISGPVCEEKDPPVLVIGAGPTGLSAAYHLGKDALLLEQNATVGGWCRSIEEGGFTFDHAGHIMFSNHPYVHELYGKLLGTNVHWQDREAWIHSNGVYTRYPFQGALYGLPPQVVAECIVGAVEARIGPLKELGPACGGSGNTPSSSTSVGKAESITDCCADGVSESTAPLARGARTGSPEAPRNFEEFIYKVWGKGIAKHFAIPYNRKLWAVLLSSMETSWLGGRVPVPDLKEMIEGALQPVPKPMGPNARFGYPLRGGFQALVNGFLELLEGGLKLDARVTRLIPSKHKLVLANGTMHSYEQLISTMPLPLLVKAAGDEASAAVRLAASKLRHVSVRCVNLGIGRENITEKHWIYYPGPSVFHRIFVQGNASPYCNPPGGFGLTCEITYSPEKPLPCEGDALIERCIADCIEVGMINADDPVLVRNQVDLPYAYVVYDHGRADSVALIREWAEQHDIILAGRYSEWEYYNSDHAFIAGRTAAARASQRMKAKSDAAALARSTGARTAAAELLRATT